ncbi:MAG: regulatory protein GemA [Roseburia sp.]|nr:regulatory protein GemA [Roseburia sp.]
MAKPSIRMLWGLAKSSELSLTDEELHLLVMAHTGKDSIRDLNQRELQTMVRTLGNMKSSAVKSSRQARGSTGTANQRKKIYKLTEALGWEKEARVNGLCKKMFGVSSVDWLDYMQCSKLIEALKAMVERKEKQDAGL